MLREEALQAHVVAFDLDVPQVADVFQNGKVSAL